MAKLTNELEETKAELERTKAKLQFDQGIRGVLPRDSSENLESPTSNEQMTKKETCEDKLSEKKCKKLKKKKNGKGCQTKSTQKKCTKTCELCPPDGKFGIIHFTYSRVWNKRAGMFINFQVFFQGAQTLFKTKSLDILRKSAFLDEIRTICYQNCYFLA